MKLPDSLRKFVGAVLLVLTVGVTSCQAFLAEAPAPEALPPASETENG
jgi:hypothetical protein